MIVLRWFKDNIRWVGPIALALALFGGGYLTGRRAGVAVTKDRAVHDATTRTEVTRTADAHVDQQASDVKVEVAPKEIVKWRVITVTKPDGTKTVTREGERDESARKVTTTETEHAVADTHATEHAVQTVTVHDVVTHEVRIPVPSALPRYLLGVQYGLSLPAALGGAPDRQLLPFLPRASHGILTIDVRVAGPLYLGVWANTGGAVGGSVRVGL